MPKLQTLENRIKYRIKRQKSPVFMLSDFTDLSDKDQIGRVLRKLIKQSLLIKVGQGVYVRAKFSILTNNLIPEISLRDIALEVLKKRKITVVNSEYEKMYGDGETTQVPTGRLITVKGRISRKIGYKGNYIKYAKARK